MLKNRPGTAAMSSPGKITSTIKDHYKRIVVRVRDDAILGDLNIPLPNINVKSISSFIARQEKRANVRATVMPKVKPHRSVTSAVSMAPAAYASQLLLNHPTALRSSTIPSLMLLESGVVRS